MGVRGEMTIEEILERSKAIDHYFDDPVTRERFLKRLVEALRDPSYILSRGRFDWKRFAREFTSGDFDPPLEDWEFFTALKPHFKPDWEYYVPRSRIWWAIRAIVGEARPLDWLLAQRAAGRRWKDIASQLDCGVTPGSLVSYVHTAERRRREAEARRIEEMTQSLPRA